MGVWKAGGLVICVLLRAFPERGCVSTFRLRGSESLVGFVLCALNVLWFAALVMSLVWNACGDSIKGRCVGAVLDASLGAEERGVETAEEAKGLLAQRDREMANMRREMAQREREMRREKAQRDATIAQRDAKIAEQDCRDRIASGHPHGHGTISPIVCRNAPNPTGRGDHESPNCQGQG